MTRVPNRGERPMHPVLETIATLGGDAHRVKISDYFYSNPEALKMVEWILDNVDPIFIPDGFLIFWWGYVPMSPEDGPAQFAMTAANGQSMKNGDFWFSDEALADRGYAFLRRFKETFPNHRDIMVFSL